MRQIPLLSICVTCRDNRESIYEDRGRLRLGRKINKNNGDKKLVSLRGIKYMSNYNRAYVLTLASDDGFTYMFWFKSNGVPNDYSLLLSKRSEIFSSYFVQVDPG